MEVATVQALEKVESDGEQLHVSSIACMLHNG